jgi:NADPH-dependent F420 reductase
MPTGQSVPLAFLLTSSVILTIGILGGTGSAGRGLAVRLANSGYHVLVGSRDAARAESVVGELRLRGEGSVRGVANEEAATGDLVVVATPWDSALATVVPLAPSLSGKVIISMVNALAKHGREMVPLIAPRGSMAAELAAALPDSQVTGAFHHLPASQMEDLDSGLDTDVIVVGDDDGARTTTAELVNRIDGLRAVVAGSLALAGAVESFTAVCISINIRHRAHSSVRLEGLAL